jgi:hypothetical protein
MVGASQFAGVREVTRAHSRAGLASYAHALLPRSLAEAAPGLATLLRFLGRTFGPISRRPAMRGETVTDRSAVLPRC